LPHFPAAIENNPEFGTGYLYLAKTLLDTGDLKGAEQAALKGLAAKPDAKVLPLGHYVLADVYSRAGREGEASRQLAAGRRAEQGVAKGAPR
jgi:tetratricopeptide (TPR) repeat protein